MTAKHSPATSLPWETEKLRAPNGGTYYRCGIPDDSSPVAQIFGTMNGGYEASKNADYIVHAANAYPKLVEALRDLVERDNAKAEAMAENLLRELGEVE